MQSQGQRVASPCVESPGAKGVYSRCLGAGGGGEGFGGRERDKGAPKLELLLKRSLAFSTCTGVVSSVRIAVRTGLTVIVNSLRLLSSIVQNVLR